MELCCLLSLLLVFSAKAVPISQPVYPNTQYVSAQAVPTVGYRQPSAPGYVPQGQYSARQQSHPVYERRPEEGLQNYGSLSQQQPLYQFQQSGRVGVPSYQQHQIQSPQLAPQAQEAFAAAQRKANQQSFSQRPVQPVPVALPSQEQPQQYNKEQQLRYISRPVTAQYRVQQRQDQKDRENEEDYDPNPSYQFGFDVKDDLYTNYQNRKEQRDGNKITGSYSVVDSDGFIRTVQYTADPKEGFKAEVTRQPTDIVVKIPKPDPQFQAAARPQQHRYIQETPQQRGHQDRSQSNAIYQYQ